MKISSLLKRINLSPLALFSAFFALCLLLTHYLSENKILTLILVSGMVLFAAAGLLFIFRKKIKSGYVIFTVILLIFGAIFGLLRGYFYGIKINSVKKGEETRYIYATVEEIVYQTEYSSSYVICVKSANGEKINAEMKLDCKYPTDIEIYDKIALYAVFSDLDDDENGFNEKKYYYSRGINTLALSEDSFGFEIIGKEKGIKYFAARINAAFCDSIKKYIENEDISAFLLGLLFGKKDGMPYIMRRNFTALGLSHIFAVSGMHLSIIIGGLDKLLKKLTVRKQIKNIILIFSIISFSLICGMQKSVLRASAMLIIFYLSFYFGNKSDSKTSLFTAFAIICAFSPASLFDTGLLLSFFATLGIITLGAKLCQFVKEKIPPKNFAARFAKYLLYIIATVFAAVLFTLPITAVNFGEISLLTPFSNLIAVFFAPVLIYLSLFLLIFAKIPFIAVILAKIAAFFANILLNTINFSGGSDKFIISLKFDTFKFLIIFICVFIFIFAVFRINKTKYYTAFLSACILFLAASVFISSNSLKDEPCLYYTGAVGGEGIVLTQSGSGMIMDTSGGSYSEMTKLCSISKKNASKPKIFLCAAYKEKYVKNFDRLFQSYYFDTLYIPSPATQKEYDIYEKLSDICRFYGINLILYGDTETNEINFYDISFMINKDKDKDGKTYERIAFRAKESSILYLGKGFDESYLLVNCEHIIFGNGKRKIAEKYDISEIKCENLYFANADLFDELFTHRDTYGKNIYFADGDYIKIIF